MNYCTSATGIFLNTVRGAIRSQRKRAENGTGGYPRDRWHRQELVPGFRHGSSRELATKPAIFQSNAKGASVIPSR